LPAFVVGCVINGSHSDWSEEESQCSFDLNLLCGHDVDHFFFSLLAICTSFENYLLSSFAHLFCGLLII
jgi:hypothetical protein